MLSPEESAAISLTYGFQPAPSSTPLPSFCQDRTAYLKTFTNDVRYPLLVEVSAYYATNQITVYMLFNLAHMNTSDILPERHSDFSLIYENQVYPNLFHGVISWNAFLMLRFALPLPSSPLPNRVISFTLHDLAHDRFYRDIQTCVVAPPKEKLPLVICAYISPYNSVEEVLQWVAYYRLQRASKIVFYYGQPHDRLRQALQQAERSGFVEFVDWTWPVTGVLKRPQRENQQTQVMSCFYRYKHITKYMLFCDVDEYIHTNVTHYGLDEVVDNLFLQNRKYNVITVRNGSESHV